MNLKMATFLILALSISASAAPITCLLTTQQDSRQSSEFISLLDVYVPKNSDLATYSFKGIVRETLVDVSVTDGVYFAYLKNGNKTAKQEFQEFIHLDIATNKAVLLQCPYSDDAELNK